MATDPLPWKLRFTDPKTGEQTVIRESSTFAYSQEYAQKSAPTHPTVVAAGGKGRLFSMIDVTPASMVPSPGPTPTPIPPSPSPSPEPPSSSWVTGKSTAIEPTTSRPARGVATPDPSFKQPVYRVTDAADPPKNFRRNDYSRRQAFNAGNTLQLVSAGDGFWHVYDADKCAHLKRLAGPAGDAEPQWHPTNPDLLYYLPTNGVGMRVYELNVQTGISRVVGDLATRLKSLWPSANAAWTKSEGSPSADGRFWCLRVDTASYNTVGVVCWDRDTDTIIGSMPSSDAPDHVSMSPSGAWCVVSSDSGGTYAYSRDFKVKKKLHHKSEHSDIATLPNGDDVYVSVDYQSDKGDVFMVNLNTGVRTTLFPSYIDGSARAFHFSGKAYGKPGWVLVSAYGEYGGPQQWMDRKITLVELKANPQILNVAWHRSKLPASDAYFFESHATISRDGSRIAFTSSWGGTAKSDLNAYQVRIPAFG